MKTPIQQIRKPIPKPTKIIRASKKTRLEKIEQEESKDAIQYKK